MKRWLSYLIVMVVFAVCGLGSAAAQKEPRPGTVIVPPTNVERPQDIGRRAHTNFLIFVPAARKQSGKPGLTGASPSGEIPASLSCVYQTWAGLTSGCPIDGTYNAPSGGTKAIAIVDAYDYPTAQSDFDTFSSQFGLPLSTDTCADGQPCFTKVYAAGKPRSNCGWAQEEALDIEWAHAMAPKAQIILVEAASNSNSDLLTAVQKATSLVAQQGGGEVSMSWGSSEYSGESTNDSYFTGSGVTYVASSGDTGGKVIWPSSSPNVVSAGGTTVNRNSSGAFTGETAWSSAGAGPSAYEPVPSYQSGIYTLAQLLNGFRGTPDLSYDANPSSGVSVYDSTSCQGLSGWLVFGGTSVSAPSLSGIFNLSGNFSGNNSIQTNLYQNYDSASSGGTTSPYPNTFYDVTSGTAGTYPATSDWDFATGIGSDRGLTGMTGSTTPSFSLSASPASLSLTAGDSGTSSITVTPSGGYTGSVTLSVTSTLPAGMGITFGTNPVDITGTSAVSSAMTVSTTTSTPAGTYDVTIKGADGSLSSSTVVQVTVSQASSGGGSFTIAASPSSQTVGRNSTANYSVTVTATSGFTGAVNLSVSGVPPQSSGSFSPSSVTLSSTTTSAGSTLTINTGAHTPTKTFILTITGMDSSGTIIQSTTVSLTLQ
ncbi:MAG: hypothetical protein P8Z30_19095 [Acidobacteriota bacterium]